MSIRNKRTIRDIMEGRILSPQGLVVLFHSDQCGHCQKIKPDFMAEANWRSRSHNGTILYAIEFNDIPEEYKSLVGAVPTYWMYPPNATEPIVLVGGDPENLQKALKF